MNARLYRRNDRNYYVIINWKDQNGVQKQKWLTTKTRKKTEALKFLERIRGEIAYGLFTEGGDQQFVPFMKEWLDTTVKSNVSIISYQSYTSTFNYHIAPYFIPLNLKLRDLKPMHFQRFCYEKVKEGLSAKTVRKILCIIKQNLRFAIQMDLLARNPAAVVTLPKITKFKSNFYDEAQLYQLIKAIAHKTIEVPVILTIALGLRRGEVIGLRWKNVDLENNAIYICESKVAVTGQGNILKGTKTEVSTRLLPIPPELTEYLKKVKARQAENKKNFGNCYIESDFVCVFDDGTPIKVEYLTINFRRELENAKLPLIRFHDLRHGNASYLFKMGLSLKEIQAWLGHSLLSTTADIYTHLDEEMKFKGAQKVAGLLKHLEIETI